MNTQKCLAWAKERGLLDTPDTSKQFQKLASECMEFLDEINKGNLEKAFLEFGDVLVTMIIYCRQKEVNFQKVFAGGVSLKETFRREIDGLNLIIAIGDCAVVEQKGHISPTIEGKLSDLLAIVLRIAHFDPQRALDAAVEKISNRKTTLVNGTAVKEEDL